MKFWCEPQTLEYHIYSICGCCSNIAIFSIFCIFNVFQQCRVRTLVHVKVQWNIVFTFIYIVLRMGHSRLFYMSRPAFTFINLYIFCNLQRIINRNIHLGYVCIYFLIRNSFVCWLTNCLDNFGRPEHLAAGPSSLIHRLRTKFYDKDMISIFTRHCWNTLKIQNILKIYDSMILLLH
jgi:hypothetical protein